MNDLVLSIAVLAAVTLLGGGIFLLRRGGARKQAMLMMLMAMVLAANVVIWSIPVANSETGEEVSANPSASE